MKKIILFAFLFIFFVPSLVFAADGRIGGRCENDKDCVREQNDLKCNLAIKKCAQTGKWVTKQGSPCLEDDNCELYFDDKERTFCSHVTWRCDENKYKEDGTACSRDRECNPDFFCKVEKDQKVGKCAEKGEAEEHDLCTNSGECDSGLECYKGACLYLKDGNGTQELGDECKFSKECAPNSYLYCVIPAGSETGECTYQKDINDPCTSQDECKNVFACVNVSGKAVTSGESGTCKEAQKESAGCSDSKPCNNPLICKKNNESDAEGTCQKPDADPLTEEQKAEQQKFSSTLDYQMNLYCNAETTPGLFTKGVSNECFNCGNCGSRDIMVVIANVINGVLQLTGLFAVLSCIVSGFMYIISRGNEEKTGKAKAALTASIVGLIIIFTGWILINTIMTVLGYNCGSWSAPNFTC